MDSTETMRKYLDALVASIGLALLGKEEEARFAVMALASEGHLLIEDVPGVGKTTLAQAMARSIAGSFKRIQFTSDLLPSDILGVTVFYPDQGEFRFHPGPIFANVVLADEINRATPKTQSALLEAMNERRVTVDSATRPLPSPFLVLATQNPAEQHGTFPLPESQLDRFFMRIRLGYPDPEAEKRVLRGSAAGGGLDRVQPVLDEAQVRILHAAVRDVNVDEPILDYVMRLVGATRAHPGVQVGVSPRGAIALFRAAQAHALLDGRDFCIPDDVKSVALPVLAHRILLKKKYAYLVDIREETEALVRELLDRTPVPL